VTVGNGKKAGKKRKKTVRERKATMCVNQSDTKRGVISSLQSGKEKEDPTTRNPPSV